MPRSLFLNVHQALLCEKEGNMFIHLFRPLTHAPLYHPPTSPSPKPIYPRIRITDTSRNSSPMIPFIERFIVRCEKKKIFIVRMIVNVRTLWLSLIQLRLRCFVATFSAVYNRRISNLQSIHQMQRGTSFGNFFLCERKGDTPRENTKRASKCGINETTRVQCPRRRK